MNSAGHHTMMEGKLLPYKKQVEWLEGSGGAWIDTGVKFNSDKMVLRLEMSLVNNLTGSWVDEFCGCAPSDGNDSTGVRFRRYAETEYADISFLGVRGVPVSGYNFYFTCRNVGMVAMNAQKGEVSGERPIGTIIATRTQTPQAKTPCNGNIYLFCGNVGGRAFRISTGMRLKTFIITNNGNPVSTIIPVIDHANNRCFYDSVRQQLIYNSGQGVFLTPDDIR